MAGRGGTASGAGSDAAPVPARCESPRRGHLALMSLRIPDRTRRPITPLTAVIGAAVVFTILLVLVRLQWPPLESADHGASSTA